jgi:hypothetical protein
MSDVTAAMREIDFYLQSGPAIRMRPTRKALAVVLAELRRLRAEVAGGFVCSWCNGLGTRPGYGSKPEDCPRCAGSGVIERRASGGVR